MAAEGRRVAGLLAAGALALVTACRSGGSGSGSASGSGPVTVPSSPPVAAPGAPAAGVRAVGAQEGLALAARRGVVVLDVRTREEFAEGHLQGARNLPLVEAYADAVAELDPAASYVLYCRTGNRSAQAAEIMRAAGFTDVADAGGLDGLQAAGGTVVRA